MKPNAWLMIESCPHPSIRSDYIELKVQGEPLGQVRNFVYLGATTCVVETIERDENS